MSSSSLTSVDKFLKLLNDTTGRDKVTKALQYGSKIIAYIIMRNLTQVKDQKEQISNLQSLLTRVEKFDEAVAIARKVTRFWKPLQGYLALLRFIQQWVNTNKTPAFLQFIGILQKLCMANYLLFDHFVWAAKMRVLPSRDVDQAEHPLVVQNLQTFSKVSTMSWMFGCLLEFFMESSALMNQFNQELQLTKRLSDEITKGKQEEVDKIKQELKQLNATKRTKMIHLVSVGCDLGVSSALAKYWEPSKGVLGLLGTIAALIGVWENWPQKI
jgi:hypothetical protein